MNIISIDSKVKVVLNKYLGLPNTIHILQKLDSDLTTVLHPGYNYVLIPDLNNKVVLNKLSIKFWPCVIPNTAETIEVCNN